MRHVHLALVHLFWNVPYLIDLAFYYYILRWLFLEGCFAYEEDKWLFYMHLA
jgi:hypothetical protein